MERIRGEIIALILIVALLSVAIILILVVLAIPWYRIVRSKEYRRGYGGLSLAASPNVVIQSTTVFPSARVTVGKTIGQN